MDDKVLYDGFMINEEVIFYVNMNQLISVRDNEENITLNVPTARCFLLLLENAGKVISRDEFMEAVWRNRGIVVSQNTFYQNISLLRKSLIKSGITQDIITTVRKKGFKISEDSSIVPVSVEDVLGVSRDVFSNQRLSGNSLAMFNVQDSFSTRIIQDLTQAQQRAEPKNTKFFDKKIQGLLHYFTPRLWILLVFIMTIIINLFSLAMIN